MEQGASSCACCSNANEDSGLTIGANAAPDIALNSLRFTDERAELKQVA